MIKSRDDYYYYLRCDKIALNIHRNRARLFSDYIWKFQRLLRKCEYLNNCKKGLINRFFLNIYRIKFSRLSRNLGFSIPLNVFGPGLSIAHYGTIVINSNTKIGKNCRIHTCVNIGATSGSKKAPIIGDNVYIGPGAKIIGDITIGDNVCIGAGAVVTKSFEKGITIGGVPAKKISDNSSSNNMPKSLIENNLL